MKLAGDWYVPDHMTGAGNHVRRYGSAVAALKYLPKDRRRVVVQAGGHIGTWARPLAAEFEKVYCWEPMWENMECLIANVGDEPNVFLTQGCLGDKPGTVQMRYSPKNTGKHCVETKKFPAPKETRMQVIDEVFKTGDRIDAIFLDIEGYEIKALLGAINTIQFTHPLILCEENGCNSRYGIADDAIEKFLAGLGYEKAERWEEDVIYTHKDWS